MASGTITEKLLHGFDRLTELLREAALTPHPESAPHLEVGNRGEEIAYFQLRQWGYTVIARNWRSRRRKGELDLVAWDEDVLCFVEVKTRTSQTLIPAEAAVNRDKMRELAGMAKLFLRRFPAGTRFRFDVVSVYLLADAAPEVTLWKDAFGWRTRAT